MGDVFNNLVVDVFCEFYCALCPTGGADSAALAWFDKLTTGEKATRSECLQWFDKLTTGEKATRSECLQWFDKRTTGRTTSRKQPY
jgi:hypothetical protein